MMFFFHCRSQWPRSQFNSQKKNWWHLHLPHKFRHVLINHQGFASLNLPPENPSPKHCLCFSPSMFSSLLKGDASTKKTPQEQGGPLLLGGSSHLVSSQDHPQLQAMERPFGRGPTTPVRELTITIVINHFLTGLILQVSVVNGVMGPL